MKSSMKMLAISISVSISMTSCVMNFDRDNNQCGDGYFLSQNCGCLPIQQACGGNGGGDGGNGGGDGGTMPTTFQGVAWSDASEGGQFFNPTTNSYQNMFVTSFCTKYGDVLAYMDHAQYSGLNADNSSTSYALATIQSKLVYSAPGTTGFNVFYMVGQSSETQLDCGQYKTTESMPAPTDSIQVSPEMFEEMRMLMQEHQN